MPVSPVPDQPDENRLVAVPAHPGTRPGELTLEARREPQGLLLPVFSSVRMLVTALGRSQPWAVMPLSRVGDLASAAGIDQIVFDPEIAADAWLWDPLEASGLTWRR